MYIKTLFSKLWFYFTKKSSRINDMYLESDCLITYIIYQNPSPVPLERYKTGISNYNKRFQAVQNSVQR